MKIYKMSRIVRLHVKATVINTTASTPAEIVLVVLPYSDYSRTLAEVKLFPKSAIRYLSGSGGIDKVSLSKSACLNSELGVDSRSIRDYQQSASEAASTLALLPDTPVLALYVGGASTEPTLRVFIEVTYDVEFFEPEFPGSVALSGQPKPKDMTNCVIETDKPRKIVSKSHSQKPRSTNTDDAVEEYFNAEEDEEMNEKIPQTPLLKRTTGWRK